MDRSRSRQGWAYASITGALCANAGMAAGTIFPLTLIVSLAPPAAVLPVLSAAYLAAAGVLALIAWSVRSRRTSDRLTLWDLAGACAFMGFAAGIFSNPEDVMTALAVARG
jgi:hypothetical protein